MGRRTRIHFPGAVYHAMSRGNGGHNIFLDTADYQEFLMSLQSAREGCRFRIYAYCLMPNHFHLLIRVGEVPLAQIMQILLTRYATRFNLIRERTGHLFQSRYKAILCTDDSYLLTLMRYIHNNPVRAKLASAPSQWPWSSHGQYVGINGSGIAETKFPLSILHDEPNQARTLLRDFMDEPLLADPDNHLESETRDSYEAASTGSPEAPTPPVMERLESVGISLANEFGTTLQEIRGASHKHSLAEVRRAFIRQALQKGIKAAEIARYLNRAKSLITRFGRSQIVNEKSERLTPRLLL